MAGGFAVCIKTGAIMRELFDAELDIVGGAKGDANNSTVRKTAEPIKLVVELIVDILKILEPKQVLRARDMTLDCISYCGIAAAGTAPARSGRTSRKAIHGLVEICLF
jgi:hypothetical protein